MPASLPGRGVGAGLMVFSVSLAHQPLRDGILRAGTGGRTAPRSVPFEGAWEGADAGFES